MIAQKNRGIFGSTVPFAGDDPNHIGDTASDGFGIVHIQVHHHAIVDVVVVVIAIAIPRRRRPHAIGEIGNSSDKVIASHVARQGTSQVSQQ
eukprot:scaffold39813_cov206-Amphora_coffeaeformis.AAC.1